MRLPSVNLATALPALALLLAGYATHTIEDALRAGVPAVQAQSRNASSSPAPNEPLAFELSGIGPNSALTLYNPADHTLYVYPEATQGNTHVSCSFMLHIGRPGAAIDRQNCAPGSTY